MKKQYFLLVLLGITSVCFAGCQQQVAPIAKTADQVIEQLFKETLGRAPDPSGAVYWKDRYTKGVSVEQLRSEIRQSPEYKTKMQQKNN